MKIVYYSTAYYASHGGSNHSKAFVDCARKNKEVSELVVFPSREMLKKPLSVSSNKKTSLFSLVKNSPPATLLRFYRRNNFYIKELLRFVRDHKPDAIVIRLDSNFLQVTELKKRFPKLVVATEVNASPFDESFSNIACRPLFQRFERIHLARADANFFVSDTLRKKIMKAALNESRDFVLPNGVDTALFRPTANQDKIKLSRGLPLDKKIVGYVGTLDISKRMSLLIEAYAKLTKVRSDVYFVIVGDGPEFSSTQNAIVENGLQDKVMMTGNVDHNEVPGYLQAFDIAIHHAANDYMCPLKLFEYLAVGLPVIGPDTSAVREIFQDKKHLVLCRPETESIVHLLNASLSDMESFKSMAFEGRKLVEGFYSWQANADTVVKTIKAAIRK